MHHQNSYIIFLVPQKLASISLAILFQWLFSISYFIFRLPYLCSKYIIIQSLVLKRLLSKQTHVTTFTIWITFWQIKMKKGPSTGGGGQKTVKYCNWRGKHENWGQLPPILYVKRGPYGVTPQRTGYGCMDAQIRRYTDAQMHITFKMLTRGTYLVFLFHGAAPVVLWYLWLALLTKHCDLIEHFVK